MNASIALIRSKLTSANTQLPDTKDPAAKRELEARIADYDAALRLLEGAPKTKPPVEHPKAVPVEERTAPGTQAHTRKLMGEDEPPVRHRDKTPDVRPTKQS